jgi:hypothetical protein
MSNEIVIKFKNVSDFRKRIARLWQDQKENECYVFNFPDKETEIECNKLFQLFDGDNKVEGNQENFHDERSKREDPEKGFGTLNSRETD